GEGSCHRSGHDHGDPQRDPLLLQQARRFHSRDRGVPRRRLAPRPLHPPALPARAGLRGDECELRAGRLAGPVPGAGMRKTPKETRRKASINRSPADRAPNSGFDEVLSLIDAAKARAVAALKMALIELYWSITALFDQRCQRCQGQAVSQCFLTESPRNGLTRQEKMGPAHSLDDQSIARNGIFCAII